jgi:hypothetical protein
MRIGRKKIIIFILINFRFLESNTNEKVEKSIIIGVITENLKN